jgi:purine-binding chemotaxis protein CheW
MSQASDTNRHFIAFRIMEELYAFDVGRAREIVEVSTITPVPHMPVWVRGIMNLRGMVLPVLDLKRKFGLGPTEFTVTTCIIIVDVPRDGQTFTVGVLTDGVRDVFALGDEAIEPPPKFGDTVATDFIEGIGRHGEQFFLILDEQKVFSSAEASLVTSASQAAV